MTATRSFLDNKVAQLVAVMSASLLVGAYGVLIGFVVWTLVANYRSMLVIHKALFGASIVMFCISVVSLGLVIQELSTHPTPVGNRHAQIGLAILQYIIGDLILVWRVWVIWGYNYLIVIGPLLIMIVGTGFGFNLLFGTQVFYMVVPAALVVTNTSLCTILIASKIWYMRRKLSHQASASSTISNQCTRALFLVVESGALYAGTAVVALVLHLQHSDSTSAVLPIVLNSEVPLTGILPTLLIILVHFGLISGQKS